MARLNVEYSTATTITVDGREVLAFGGCNYLGLAHHPAVLGAVREGLSQYGISTTASRETTGNTVVHDRLEEDLAAYTGQEASILLADGYTANIAVAQALTHTHGVALIDAKAHRSLRSAATAAGMQVFEYEHRSGESAAWLVRQYGDQGVAIFTDGVFAADGAVAPVAELLKALPTHRGTLVVDDCHGLCVLGRSGAGTVDHVGIKDPRVCITTTLAKGLGCYGGAVIGRRPLVESVRERADVYRRSTPVPTPIAMGARAAVAIVQKEPGLVEGLRRNTAAMSGVLSGLGVLQRETERREPIPIFTFTLKNREHMERVHRGMLEAGIYAPFIEYPGGPQAMFFRLTVSAKHTQEQIARLGQELARLL
mgnify:CR=1 FL=1